MVIQGFSAIGFILKLKYLTMFFYIILGNDDLWYLLPLSKVLSTILVPEKRQVSVRNTNNLVKNKNLMSSTQF